LPSRWLADVGWPTPVELAPLYGQVCGVTGRLAMRESIQVSSGVAHLVPAFDMFSVFRSPAVVPAF
jgi:hypothetical protein